MFRAGPGRASDPTVGPTPAPTDEPTRHAPSSSGPDRNPPVDRHPDIPQAENTVQTGATGVLRASSGHVLDHRRGIGQVGAKIAVAGVYGVRASVRW
jgi:hypothetical protein